MPEENKIRVIMHDSVSIDGSSVNFEYTQELLGLHYQLAAQYGGSLRLFGSATAEIAIEMFGGFTPETSEDMAPPLRPETLSYWIVVDSKAKLLNKLHYFRRSEYCRDMAVLVCKDTSHQYIEYLRRRGYDYFVAGKTRVDLAEGLKLITAKYGCNTVLVDSGRELTNALLNRGLVDEVSLLVCPQIIGEKGENLFSKVEKPLALSDLHSTAFPDGYVHLSWKVKK